VVFVDDLDRCSPDRVVEAIEVVNQLFTSSSNHRTAFVLGMDVDMVAASIRTAHQDMIAELKRRSNPASEDYGFRFLGKIVQLCFSIPTPDRSNTKSFVRQVARPDEGQSAVPEAREAEVREWERELDRQSSTVTELGDVIDRIQADTEFENPASFKAAVARVATNRLNPQSPDVVQHIEYAAEILKRKPRDIKIFVNALRLQVPIAYLTPRISRTRPDLRQISKWTALQLRWPILAEEMKRRAALLRELEDYSRDAESEQPEGWSDRVKAFADNEELMSVLREEPRLGDADFHGMLAVT